MNPTAAALVLLAITFVICGSIRSCSVSKDLSKIECLKLHYTPERCAGMIGY